jgi:hypothetical protein
VKVGGNAALRRTIAKLVIFSKRLLFKNKFS